MAKTRIAWTGHRPKDLPDWSDTKFRDTLEAIAPDERWRNAHFIVGGALGVDSWAAKFAMTHGVTFDLHLPFTPGVQSRGWSDFDKELLEDSIKMASEVRIIGDNHYDVAMYQKRNISMVDTAVQVFTIWSGKRYGGTWNCIQYAHRVQKPVFNLITGKVRRVTQP
jgi:uncharacterized phage-like protein YoqJ